MPRSPFCRFFFRTVLSLLPLLFPLLLTGCAKPTTPLMKAAQEGRLDEMRALLKTGSAVDETGTLEDSRKTHRWPDSTPLMAAAQFGQVDAASLLLQHGADLHREGAWTLTALHLAAWGGQTSTAELLIRNGAKVNPDNPSQVFLYDIGTPLSTAAIHGDIPMMKLLLAYGADINLTNSCNVTPLFVAAENGHLDAVKYLVKNGADPAIPATQGSGCPGSPSALAAARKEGHAAIAAFLTEALAGRVKVEKVVAARPVDPDEEAAFAKAAAAFRSGKTMPFPEEARRYKAQAEGAFQDRRLEDAAALYAKALKAAPWWPEGRFNRALLLAELGRYEEAIREMKKYLQLAPLATDATAAQDRIYQWEGKIE